MATDTESCSSSSSLLAKSRNNAKEDSSLSAYEVFLSFIRRVPLSSLNDETVNEEIASNDTSDESPVQDASVVDALPLFSKECYEEWLSTRTMEVNNPEQTFHRIVIAHVRGADSRKPFPEDIEEAVLKLLRQKKKNIWDRVFGDNKLNVGKRGFKQQGYHEFKRSSTQSERVAKSACALFEQKTRELAKTGKVTLATKSEASDQAFGGAKEKRQKVKCAKESPRGKQVSVSQLNLQSQRSITRTDDSQSTGTISLVRNNTDSNNVSDGEVDPLEFPEHGVVQDETFFNLEEMRSQDIILNSNPMFMKGRLAAEDTVSAEYLASLFGVPTTRELEVTSGLITPWERLLNVLDNIGHREYLSHAEKLGARFGRALIPPAVVYILSKQPPDDDIRFNEKFIYPPPHESFFLAHRPIGKITMDLRNMIIVEACPAAKQLLRYNPVGDFVLNWHASLVECWYGHIFALQCVGQSQGYWKRSLRLRGDGTTALLLTRQVPTKACYGLIHLEFQDQSDLFQHVLNRPYFI